MCWCSNDLQVLRNVEAVIFIRAFAAGLPSGFHLAGPREVVSLSRLRSEGRCIEFGPDDLAFTEQDARAS